MLIGVGILPKPIKSQKNPIIRRDVSIIPIQPNMHFEVYWKVLDIGKGPAVILYAYNKEIVKFDFFGDGDGHYHIRPYASLRIYFIEKNAKDQLQRAIHELLLNAQKYLKNQPEEIIQDLKINRNRFSIAIEEMEKEILYILKNVEDVQGI